MNKTPDLIEQRLHNQKLLSTEFQRPADVVRWMGAVQAQDFHAAKWALALRMPATTSAVLQDAYDRGEILRTHVMRPTWHFVTPDDIRWLLALTAPRLHQRCGSTYRKYEVGDAVFKRARRVLIKALEGGKHLTRAELRAVLKRAGIDASDTVRMGHIMLRAELDAIVCSGPLRGKQFTYALFEERVPPATETLERDEALVRLTVRYFTSHGPAALPDFVWWSGLATADARRGIALAAAQLVQLKVADTIYWTGSNPPNLNTSTVRANLLPWYDEYNVAYKDREHHPLGPTVVVNGMAVGTWTSRIDHHSVLVEVTRVNQSQKRLLRKAADKYGSYLELPARVAYGL